ncbi:hypothetical protein PN838_17820 [Psychrosphaera sp. G1-22]|uniref:Sulfatase n=1 Tax=Psychrosphaera algicola TaxID=3023714 RepID=A0ABT5FFF1_9GAMM|nr:hypothetical protein [Psychrosphaera sp. G1-22]MDC2890275.1 hypothetical protein [Psychrosphaera sp. G1-22]
MFAPVYSVLRPFVIFSAALLIFLTATRFGLAMWQVQRFDTASSLIQLFVNGLRIDLSLLGYLCALPALLHPWLVATKFRLIWLNCLKIWFFIAAIAVLFFELATPAFIIEYGFRPNRLFIEYLAYPDEVTKMLVNGHSLTLIVVFTALIVASKFIWKYLGNSYQQVQIPI